MKDNGGYTSADIMSMQQDAIRRVHEMQKQAQQKINPSLAKENFHSNGSNSTNNNGNMRHNSNPSPNPAFPPLECEMVNKGFSGLLSSLNLDQEKLIVILLLIILINEGADSMLVLALVYILI